MFVFDWFDWFMVSIVDPNFVWSAFKRSVYVADKLARAVLKRAPSTPTPVASSTAPVSSTINFSTDFLAADAKHQATPAVPSTVATLKPHKLWTSPSTADMRKGNTGQVHSTYLVLSSSLSFDVIEFTESCLPLQSHLRSTYSHLPHFTHIAHFGQATDAPT
jgi:hypothetical protein